MNLARLLGLPLAFVRGLRRRRRSRPDLDLRARRPALAAPPLAGAPLVGIHALRRRPPPVAAAFSDLLADHVDHPRLESVRRDAADRVDRGDDPPGIGRELRAGECPLSRVQDVAAFVDPGLWLMRLLVARGHGYLRERGMMHIAMFPRDNPLVLLGPFQHEARPCVTWTLVKPPGPIGPIRRPEQTRGRIGITYFLAGVFFSPTIFTSNLPVDSMNTTHSEAASHLVVC